ncbi:hypothetical protein [Agreia sp. VKM Ac-1783]|uniref:hypothetical protein n=1 Tax=Agreia sp. VKM Ac-1783 TaxID=1938889 RepID=UPI000A2AC42D|nr:hypothetical protein [Agreia sp. VKM Ac-1783]SMQ71911.1 hypothetical protein SAMN06295943_2795 [Agreia sp. VKM Ac-1783]
MSRHTIKFSQQGMQDLHAQITANINAADAAFRATHEGFPIDVVEADAAEALPLDLNADGLHAYDVAVASGEPFEFVLR